MFTLEQVDGIHDRLGSASTLGAFLQALGEIGVVSSDSYVTDGHATYFGVGGHEVSTGPAHDVFEVAAASDRDAFLAALEQGSYVEMSRALAAAGVEKWTFDTQALTITYYDRAGTALLSEEV
ncbi:DUF1398 domain-containing protein [Kribbella antibiotica]|uniref:DUF1398 domain-containing protein n=1 Tax=Kribbella antibiotica TaxID=190195 RepID=A0A4R4Z6D4_9ACTN|nr:DUF1398 family protein [Kribbella antibiotica]TDD52654.1 DUF1398 domain-containing protein [Kribbella antibiotica]